MTILNNIFTFIIALLPVLSSYRSIVPGVDLGTFLLILVGVVIFCRDKIYLEFSSSYCLILYYVMFVSPIAYLTSSFGDIFFDVAIDVVILRWLRFLVLFMFVFVFGLRHQISVDKIIYYMGGFVKINTIFVFLQHLMFSFGEIINNPFLDFVVNEAYFPGLSLSGLFRPSGLFLEPAHLAQYYVVYLVYVLFNNNANADYKNLIYAGGGMLMSGSGMGILMVAGFVLLKIFILRRFNLLKSLVFSVLVIVVGYVIYDTGVLNQYLFRVFGDGGMHGGVAVQGRVGYGYLIYSDLFLTNQLIGCGFGNVPPNIYLNGLTYILITVGIIGLGIILWTVYLIARNSLFWQKILAGIYLILIPAAQMFTVGSLVFYLLLIRGNYDDA